MSDFKKKYLKISLIGIAVLIILAIAFFAGDKPEPTKVASPTEAATAEPDDSIVFSETHELASSPVPATAVPTDAPSATPVTMTVNETMQIDVPKENMCTVSVSCKDIDRTKLSAEKQKLIPADGFILPETSVVINDGESVYDLLQRVLAEKKIHFVAKNTPGVGKYVSGIGNLFEKDGGELSGWGFMVNGEYPVVAATELKVSNGDKIEWVYFQ